MMSKKTFLLITSVIVVLALAGLVFGTDLIVKTNNPDFKKDPEFYKSLGNYFVKQGELEKARLAYENCLLIGEDNAARNNLALIYHEQGKYSEAINQLRALIITEPGNPSYHYDLAVNLVDKFRNSENKDINDLLEALLEFEKADQLEPGYMYATENIEVIQRVLNEG
jgi:tetratricopeptide (TPR) repeat protein